MLRKRLSSNSTGDLEDTKRAELNLIFRPAGGPDPSARPPHSAFKGADLKAKDKKVPESIRANSKRKSKNRQDEPCLFFVLQMERFKNILLTLNYFTP